MKTSRSLSFAHLAVVALVACSAHQEDASAPAPLESSSAAAAPQPAAPPCGPGEVDGPDGACITPTPPNCAQGFRADGRGGCDAVLPKDTCPTGQMAIPGETECHEVMPCAPGAWGDIPDTPTTVHVDASFAGATSDGTRAKPFTTIRDAVKVAPSGATIAIAAGTYDESVFFHERVDVRGVCPSKVEVRSPEDGSLPALAFGVGSDGSTVRGVAVSRGVGILLAVGHLSVDHVWVHDTRFFAIGGQSYLGVASMEIHDVLAEGTRGAATFAVLGIEALVERTVIRDSAPDVDGLNGRPISVESSSEHGTQGKLTLRASVLEKSRDVGVAVQGSVATIEGTVIRDITPAPDANGRGIVVQSDQVGRAKAVVRGSIVERTEEVAIVAVASDVEIEDTVVRDTNQTDKGKLGVGIQAELDPESRVESTLVLRRSVVERNHSGGVAIVGAKGTIEDTLVRDTEATRDGLSGMGVVVQYIYDPKKDKAPHRASASLTRCIVSDNRIAGISTISADTTLESVRVTNTKPRVSDGLYGDGLTVLAADIPASLTINRTSLEGNPRAGLSNFGASARVKDSRFRCNEFDLNGESVGDHPFVFESAGANRCGCDADVACRAVSADLTPPPATP